MDYQALKPTVLVVEDQTALRRLIVRMLDRHGIAGLEAGRAVQGLSIVRERHGAIDLAVVDMVMPGMSGLDLATELEREYPNVKILYISGYTDSIAMDVIARREPDAVLLKPFTERALVDHVKRLLEMPPRKMVPADGAMSPPTRRNGTSG